MRWVGHVARMREERKVYTVLVRKPEGKRPLGIPRRRWKDGIRMDLREIGRGSVEWVQLAQYRGRWRAVVNTVMNLQVLMPQSQLIGYFRINEIMWEFQMCFVMFIVNW
jgi:hypothetical protein